MHRHGSLKLLALFALVILSALVAVAAARLDGSAQAQEVKSPPAKEPKSEPGAREKSEKAPEKSEEKLPKKVEEKVPMKVDEKAPMKVDGKIPMKSDGKAPGVRPEPRKTDPLVPGRKVDVKNPAGAPKATPGDAKKDPIDGKRPVPMPGTKVPRPVPKVGEKIPMDGLPADFEAQQRRAYDRLREKELTFEEYLGFATGEFLRLRALEKNPASRYRPGGARPVRANTACGNGGFEDAGGLTSAEWSGGHGAMVGTVVDFTNFTSGLFPGAIGDVNAHQTLVTTSAQDPFVGINMTGPNTLINQPVSGNAVRIGNAVTGARAELLSKTFTVTPSDTLIRFWYAVVFQDPGHPPSWQPAFQVRVLDNSSGTPVVKPGLADLGNGTPMIFADSMNPLFQVKTVPGKEPIVFKDWSCAQINLSTLVGKNVTIQFVTQDCSAGGHWGYAYIDDVCGTCKGSPAGDLTFAANSTSCGKGNICFDFTLPTAQNAAGSVTGTAVITLDIYQNGTKLTLTPPLVSPTLTSASGTNYCFGIIDPVNIPGIDPTAGGFDFVANGTFTLGTNVQVLSVGTVPDGRLPGSNNDYKIACGGGETTDGCCLGKNLVVNGDFEKEGEKPLSDYEVVENPDQLVPGTVEVIKVGSIGKACENWKLPAACKGTKYFNGFGMLVNGLTNQPTGSTSTIWSQQLMLKEVSTGGKNPEYRVCFRYLPLPQCCFDIPAKPSLVVTGPNGPISLTNVSDVDTGCGHLYSARFAGGGAVNLQMVLPEDGKGDGNDLLIDNISVAQLVNVPATVMAFTVVEGLPTGSIFTATATTPPGLTNGPYNWVWELWDDTNGVTIPTSVPANSTTASFTGLAVETLYYIKLKVTSDCNPWTGTKRPVGHFMDRSRKTDGKLTEELNPLPITSTKRPQLP